MAKQTKSSASSTVKTTTQKKVKKAAAPKKIESTTKKKAPKAPSEEKKLAKKSLAKSAKPVLKKEKLPITDIELDSIISDDHIDIAAFDREHNDRIADIAKPKKSSRAADLAPTCPQGKQPKVIRDNPHTGPSINTSQYITELHVSLSTQDLRITWISGKIEHVLCSPNPLKTPKGNFVVGMKCGPKHTNFKKDGMAWFTALAKYGMIFGFHNSQRVALGVVSHGCIRVACAHAKMINQNSWSGKTKIKIVK